jgi:outer membrane biosynthesis protein TonB
VLAAGPHVLAVSAPRFQFFTDTIVIRGGDTLELTPQLQPIGVPAPPAGPASPQPQAPAEPVAAHCSPGAGYNADDSCFDERPKPVNPPLVPLPEGVSGSPRPSLLWVKVSADGRTLDLRRLRASDDSTFERAARDFVWTVTWHPALKDGSPVEAWTQMLFPPLPQ